ncbi:MAG TPA: hypothetical protein P5013_06535 [Methanoregula sp.]|nr:hypothetical protein [Methanoregula sp.]
MAGGDEFSGLLSADWVEENYIIGNAGIHFTLRLPLPVGISVVYQLVNFFLFTKREKKH